MSSSSSCSFIGLCLSFFSVEPPSYVSGLAPASRSVALSSFYGVEKLSYPCLSSSCSVLGSSSFFTSFFSGVSSYSVILDLLGDAVLSGV